VFSMGCKKLTYHETLSPLNVVCNDLIVSANTCVGSYRYGFQGQEVDNEIKGEGNSYSWTERTYDPRIGRWLSLDGRQDLYVALSPYAFTGNNPIAAYEVNGDFFNFIAAGIGAAVGAVVGAAVEYGSQVYANVKDGKAWGDAFTDVNFRKIGASAAEGAVTGTMAGLTGGASLVVMAAAGVSTSIIGGGIKRKINGEEVLNGKSILVDGITGGLGGGVQKFFSGKIIDKVASNIFSKKIGGFVIKKAPGIGRAIGKAIGKKSDGIINSEDTDGPKPVIEIGELEQVTNGSLPPLQEDSNQKTSNTSTTNSRSEKKSKDD